VTPGLLDGNVSVRRSWIFVAMLPEASTGKKCYKLDSPASALMLKN
jgi:hypothetical protein